MGVASTAAAVAGQIAAKSRQVFAQSAVHTDGTGPSVTHPGASDAQHDVVSDGASALNAAAQPPLGGVGVTMSGAATNFWPHSSRQVAVAPVGGPSSAGDIKNASVPLVSGSVSWSISHA